MRAVMSTVPGNPITRHIGVGIPVALSNPTQFVRDFWVEVVGSPQDWTGGGLPTCASSTRAQISGAAGTIGSGLVGIAENVI